LSAVHIKTAAVRICSSTMRYLGHDFRTSTDRVCSFRRALALGLGGDLPPDLDPLQDALAILVELELGDDDVAGVDAHGDALARCLVARHALDVDDVFETVHRRDLALLILVAAADDRDLVVFADGDAADLVRGGSLALDKRGTRMKKRVSGEKGEKMEITSPYVVLLSQLLAQRSAHDVSPDARRRAIVRLARLPSRGMEGCRAICVKLVGILIGE